MGPFSLSIHSGLFAFLLCAAASGCAGPENLAPFGRTEVISAGDAVLEVDTGARVISLRRGDATLLRFPSDAIEIGTVAALSDAVNYDPYRFYAPNPLYSPPAVVWRRAASLSVLEATGARISVQIGFEGGSRATLTLTAVSSGRLKAFLKPEEGGEPIAYFRLRPRASDDEGFYGLGEYFDHVNHRGKVRAMQLEFTPELESSYNEAHVPVPFVIGTRGWGLFVESPYPGVFALATEEADRIDAAFGTGLASGEGLLFHLFAAERPLDVTRHYYDVTGYPRLPARWALGPWIWRDESKDQAEVESDLNTIRDLDLATTGYWIDRPYATGVNTFDFNKAQFPGPQGMIDLAHDLGFRMALWHTPYLDEADPSTEALRDHATANGFYPKEAGLKLNKWGLPVDLTNRDAYSWWQGLIRKYTDMGIEGFKLDYGEDIVPGLTIDRNRWVFADGRDERTMHHGFQLIYHQVYREILPKDGGFLLCRAGKYGDQVNVGVIWPGDLDANFARHGDPIPGEATAYVGGLHASVVAGLSLGPSGFPFYGSDTGGYRHSPPDKETFTRWFQQTALSTVMQVGTSTNNVAWEFSPETGFDQEMLDWYRVYTRLHLRLFPYEWTYAKAIEEDGRPIQRPLGLAFPELGEHPSDIYMFGDFLLVAPVVDRGSTKREVILPEGEWIDWWDGTIYEGGTTMTVDAPLGKLPLFIMEGGIVPMLRPTIDTLAPVKDPQKVDSYATSPGILYARIAAGAASAFRIFDGAEVRQERKDGAISLGWTPGNEFKEGVMFEVIALGEKPAKVTSEGSEMPEHPSLAELEAAPSGWAYEGGLSGTLYVKAAGNVEVTLP
ncbi:MAG: hypothetical protein L6Q76_07595 [Polyangiaceae bacterium]|nr:hypothetical protein [Polyangiaceae bacterium]